MKALNRLLSRSNKTNRGRFWNWPIIYTVSFFTFSSSPTFLARSQFQKREQPLCFRFCNLVFFFCPKGTGKPRAATEAKWQSTWPNIHYFNEIKLRECTLLAISLAARVKSLSLSLSLRRLFWEKKSRRESPNCCEKICTQKKKEEISAKIVSTPGILRSRRFVFFKIQELCDFG